MILQDGRWYVADPLSYRQFEEMMFRATVIMRQQFADSIPDIFQTRSSPAYSRER
jgi:hypothetical protein